MPRVLIVDDDQTLLSAVRSVLVRAGHDVVAVMDGPSAITALTDHPFDAAVIDYDIPAPNGLEVLERLRELRPSCVGILASGALDLDAALQAINRGAVARVLTKPFRGAELVEAVASALAMRQDRAHERILDSAQTEALAECLQGKHVSLAIQPIIRVSDGKVAAYEALLRSRHGLLDGPLPLVTAAEQSDQLQELGGLVAELAKIWLDAIPGPERLFVNLHPHQLAQPSELLASLEPLHDSAGRVVLEITERSRLDDSKAWRTSIERLVWHGYRIAIDDLGSGFSTLAMLAELKPSVVKVDQSIVRGANADDRKRKLLEMLALFAAATETELVAEGVETEAEAATAVRCGAPLLQGYFFGRPAFELHSEVFEFGAMLSAESSEGA